jgi:hypothetical protein
LGGVSVCPFSAQGLHRKMRAPAFDTLKLSSPPQNPQSGDVIAFLKALPLSFRYGRTIWTSSDKRLGPPLKGQISQQFGGLSA